MTEEQCDSHNEALYEEFRALLDAGNKEGCITFALSPLETGEPGIVELYDGILARGAREEYCALRERPICI